MIDHLLTVLHLWISISFTHRPLGLSPIS
jgi:hypothetical protein